MEKKKKKQGPYISDVSSSIRLNCAGLAGDLFLAIDCLNTGVLVAWSVSLLARKASEIFESMAIAENDAVDCRIPYHCMAPTLDMISGFVSLVLPGCFLCCSLFHAMREVLCSA